MKFKPRQWVGKHFEITVEPQKFSWHGLAELFGLIGLIILLFRWLVK